MPIAVGSDVGPFPHGTQAREFVLMVKYGMTPLAAIQAGTLNGAKLLGWQGQIGALKAGYFADIIAVPGDPLEDICVLTEGRLRDEGRRRVSRRAVGQAFPPVQFDATATATLSRRRRKRGEKEGRRRKRGTETSIPGSPVSPSL